MNTQSPVVAGVFEQFPQARQAYLDLQAAGFADEQIGVAQHNREEIDLRQSFQQLGMPQEQASAYDQQYRAGRIIVSVRPDGRDQEATAILQKNGAVLGQDSASGQVNATYEGTSAAPMSETSTIVSAPDTAQGGNTALAGTNTTRVQSDVNQEQALRLREERLRVDKDKVQTGQVQIHKEIVTEQKTITVPVTHEEVVIEHRQVSADQAGNVAPIGDEETIRIPVSEEQVFVTKRPVVTNEVVVGKREVQETQRVSDTIRHEEARIDQQGSVPIHGLDESVADKDTGDTVNTTDTV